MCLPYFVYGDDVMDTASENHIVCTCFLYSQYIYFIQRSFSQDTLVASSTDLYTVCKQGLSWQPSGPGHVSICYLYKKTGRSTLTSRPHTLLTSSRQREQAEPCNIAIFFLSLCQNAELIGTEPLKCQCKLIVAA